MSGIGTVHFIKLLLLNVQNQEMGDEEFRDFIENTLPIVEGYDEAMDDLDALGKIPVRMPYRGKKEDTTSTDFRDRAAESFIER